jgi:hypothetical protein
MRDNIISVVSIILFFVLFFALTVFIGYLIYVSDLPDWFKFFSLH